MRILIIALIALLLSGCSNKLAYNNLDWIITWYSDDYLNLDDEQSDIYEQELLKLLAWHRQEELPRYKHHLLMMHEHIQSPFDQDDIQFHINEIRQHWRRIRTQVNEKIAPLAGQLSAEQVNDLFKELEKRNNEKLKEHNSQTPEERRQVLLERWEDTLSDIFGRLTAQQIALLKTYSDSHAFLTPQRIAYLSRYQAALKQVMIVSKQSINEHLKPLLNNPEQFKSEAYLRASQANQDHLVTFLSAFSKSLNPQQISQGQLFLLDHVDTIDNLISNQ